MNPLNIIENTLPDTANTSAGLVDRWDPSLGWLVFRGLEAGPGISINVLDADNDVHSTIQKKIVITSSAAAGTFTGVDNLGSGLGVFKDTVNTRMQLRTIEGSENIQVELVGDTIRISGSATPATARTLEIPGDNKAAVLVGMNGAEMQFRRIIGGTGIQVTENPESVLVEAAGLGEINTASTVGTGVGIFKEKVGADLRLRSLVAGNCVTLTQTPDTIVIDAKGEQIEAANRGTVGAEVFASKVGSTLGFRRLRAGSNISLNQTPDTIEITATAQGAHNTGKSKGRAGDGGFEIYAGMDGDTLLFKKLYAGPNITILDNGCGLMIAAGIPAGTGGDSSTGISLGSGHAVYAGKQDQFLKFKSLVPGPGATITSTGEEIMVSAQTDAVNLGEGVGLFENRSGSNLYFRSLIGGPGVQIDQDADTVTLSVAGATGMTLGPLAGGGSYDDPIAPGCPEPAALGWTADTPVNEALAELNRLLGVMLPPRPPILSTKTLAMANSTMVPLPADAVDNTGGQGPAAGTMVQRITSLPAVTADVTDFRFADEGTLTAILNGAPAGAISLNTSDNTGTNGSLEILRDGAYPEDGSACLWKALSARIRGTVPAGLNSYQLVHSRSGSTNRLFFLYTPAPPLPNPSITGFTVSAGSGPTVYSSSVPHYGETATVLASLAAASLDDVQGRVEIDGETPIGPVVTLTPGSGLANPPADPSILTGVPFVIDGDAHTTTRLRVRSTNSTSTSTYSYSDKLVNVMTGIVPELVTPLQEQAIPVVNLGAKPVGVADAAVRIIMSGTDTPADDVSSLLVGNWDSSAPLALHDAAIVGGVLRADQTNYGTYLPAGPDLSNRNADQYVTFMVRRASASAIYLDVQGSYTGCWIKLPGYESRVPEAANGWWDAFQLYGGSGIPGEVGNSVGCALPNGAAPDLMGMDGKTSGVFRLTFGTANSSFSTNNIILVRFKLTGTDTITGLALKGNA